MKKKLLSILAVFGLILASGCGNNAKEENDVKEEKPETKVEESAEEVKKDDEETLIVYSPNSEGLINSIIPAFEEKYGITVQLEQAGTGELFTKLRGEASAPVADVIFGGSFSTYSENKDLFEEYVSSHDSELPEAFRNKDGYKTSYTLDGSVIIVNKDLTDGIEIKGYKDLLNPELKGKIATSDPTSSSSAFSHLTNMLVAMGGYESDEAWDYVDKLFKNIDGKIQSSSSSVYKTVVDGEMAVGISYEDPVMQLIKDGADNIDIVYMEEGVIFLPAGSGIIKNCSHPNNAKLFMDFLNSKEAQDILGTQTTNRPIREDAEVSDFMKPITEIKQLQEDYDYVNENREKIIERFTNLLVEAGN